VRTLRAWLDAAGIREGRVFRSLSNGRLGKSLTDRAVASIIKDATAGAGLDGDYSGHSLRAGLATSAARSGKHDRDIMTQGRWLSHEMLATYVRDARLFGSHNAADGL
jgi:integrase